LIVDDAGLGQMPVGAAGFGCGLVQGAQCRSTAALDSGESGLDELMPIGCSVMSRVITY
jgi:hypothetical protein